MFQICPRVAVSRSLRRGSFSKQRRINRTSDADRPAESLDQSDSFVNDRGQDVGNGFALERPPARKHLEEDDAECPDVGTLVGWFPARLLGRHVGSGAENQAHLGRARGQCGRVRQIAGSGGRVEGLGQTEIENLDSLLVRGFQGVGDLPCDAERVGYENSASLRRGLPNELG
jgi:hypothetical protein